MTQRMQNMLRESWHQCDSVIPFLKPLHALIKENKLSSFDMSFIQNWVQKRLMGNTAEQMHRLVH